MKRVVLPLRTWLALSHLFVLVLPLVAVIGTGALAWDLRRQTAVNIENQALVLSELVAERVRRAGELPEAVDGLDLVLERIRGQTLAGFRVVDQRGVVVASSASANGEDLSDEPEVAAALAGKVGSTDRPRARTRAYSPGGPGRGAAIRVFVAVPVVVNGRVVGAVVTNRTPREEVQAIWQMAPRMWLGLVLALVTTMGLGLLGGHLLSRNLVRMAAMSHRIADGSIAGTALMARPSKSHVSETRELAQAVSDMAGRLQARLGYIREFAGNVSHEFKTPLSTLQGTIELLADDQDMPPEQRARFLRNAGAEVDRMGRLVAGLLALARAEERVDHRQLDVDEVVSAVAARHPGVRVEGRVGTLVGNAEQLDLALENLVENAERYGGDGVVVRIVCATADDVAHIDVIDDGPGISAANLPQVTERFFTTAREGGGTGLGLALVEAVCSAHGGRLELESEPGRTRVRLVLARG